MKILVPFFKQEKKTTCGPACLRMILSFHGESCLEDELEMVCETGWLGNTCEEIAKGSEKLGFLSEVIENITFEDLQEMLESRYPIIALLSPSVLYGGIVGFGHFVVIIGLEIEVFFEAWGKYSFKGVKIWKSTKK
ncbi:MAG: hypothetical protein GY754_07280 [bacterium]|nr:hypothetical protein [bacterium]